MAKSVPCAPGPSPAGIAAAHSLAQPPLMECPVRDGKRRAAEQGAGVGAIAQPFQQAGRTRASLFTFKHFSCLAHEHRQRGHGPHNVYVSLADGTRCPSFLCPHTCIDPPGLVQAALEAFDAMSKLLFSVAACLLLVSSAFAGGDHDDPTVSLPGVVSRVCASGQLHKATVGDPGA